MLDRKQRKEQDALEKQVTGTAGMARANNPFNLTNSYRDNYQTYPYDYFSGTTSKVYIGDIFVDDIITIQFSVSQTKEPIYGYASQVFDAVAKGTRIVQGTMTVAFKEVGYLNSIDKLLKIQQEKASTVLRKGITSIASIADKIEKANSSGLAYDPSFQRLIKDNGISAGSLFADNVRKNQTIEDVLINEKIGNTVFKDVFGGNPEYGSNDFEDIAEALEDTIWGDKNGREYPNLGKKVLLAADEFDYYQSNGQRNDYVTIGKNRFSDTEDYSKTLNILITFGDINNYKAEHTMHILNDVHFTSQSMIVSPTGEPIAETYTFFARDIDRTIESFNVSIDKITNPFAGDIVEDKEELDKILDNTNLKNTIKISIIKEFLATWVDLNIEMGEIDVVFSQSRPILDQISEQLDLWINERILEPDKIATGLKNCSQLMVKTSFNSSMGETSSLNFIMEQKVPSTATFKVIAPTRQNYFSTSIIDRAELFDTADKIEAKAKLEQDIIDAQAQLDAKKKMEDAAAYDIAKAEQKKIDDAKRAEEEEAFLKKINEDAKITESTYKVSGLDLKNIITTYGDKAKAIEDAIGVSSATQLALISVESHGDPTAVSNVGAFGLTQVTEDIRNRYENSSKWNPLIQKAYTAAGGKGKYNSESYKTVEGQMALGAVIYKDQIDQAIYDKKLSGDAAREFAYAGYNASTNLRNSVTKQPGSQPLSNFKYDSVKQVSEYIVNMDTTRELVTGLLGSSKSQDIGKQLNIDTTTGLRTMFNKVWVDVATTSTVDESKRIDSKSKLTTSQQARHPSNGEFSVDDAEYNLLQKQGDSKSKLPSTFTHARPEDFVAAQQDIQLERQEDSRSKLPSTFTHATPVDMYDTVIDQRLEKQEDSRSRLSTSQQAQHPTTEDYSSDLNRSSIAIQNRIKPLIAHDDGSTTVEDVRYNDSLNRINASRAKTPFAHGDSTDIITTSREDSQQYDEDTTPKLSRTQQAHDDGSMSIDEIRYNDSLNAMQAIKSKSTMAHSDYTDAVTIAREEEQDYIQDSSSKLTTSQQAQHPTNSDLEAARQEQAVQEELAKIDDPMIHMQAHQTSDVVDSNPLMQQEIRQESYDAITEKTFSPTKINN